MTNHWRAYKATSSLPWNIQRVSHLHRRAGFGATWTELARDLQDGVDNSVSRVLAGESRVYAQRDDFESISHILSEAAAGSDDEDRLRASWLFRMLFTPHPLREKLTLLWHNHFATSNLKVGNLNLMWQQNEWLRRQALGSFRDLLKGMVRDPAMLIWLDANTNRRGQSNENLARELMELFTLGLGNYSEDDVREAARALTGWSVKTNEAKLRSEFHDAGMKTILGKSANFDSDSLVDWLLDQEATRRRIAWRLCDEFMGESVVSDEAVRELAEGLHRNNLDISWAVSTILKSELFFSEANIATRISSPVEYVIRTVRSLEMLDDPPSTVILAQWTRRMGQDLFRPPNVGGWSGGRSWMNTRAIVARANFAVALVSGELRSPRHPPAFQTLIDRYVTADAKRALSKEMLLDALCLVANSERHSPPTGMSIDQLVVQLLCSPQAFLM